MRVITRGERIYFGAVGLLALWVGIWGYFIPDKVDKAIPWLVPPLHARFLGAMYLSGTTFMIGGILARYYAEVRGMVRVILIWTGLVASLISTNRYFGFGGFLPLPFVDAEVIWRELLRPISRRFKKTAASKTNKNPPASQGDQ